MATTAAGAEPAVRREEAAAAALQLVSMAEDVDGGASGKGEALATSTNPPEAAGVAPVERASPEKRPASSEPSTVPMKKKEKRRRPSIFDLHALLHGAHCCYTEHVRAYGARPCLHTRPGDGFSHVDFLLPDGTLDCPLNPPKQMFEQQPQQQQQPVFIPVPAPCFVRKRQESRWQFPPQADPGPRPAAGRAYYPPQPMPMQQPMYMQYPPQMQMPPPQFLGPRHFRPAPSQQPGLRQPVPPGVCPPVDDDDDDDDDDEEEDDGAPYAAYAPRPPPHAAAAAGMMARGPPPQPPPPRQQQRREDDHQDDDEDYQRRRQPPPARPSDQQ